MNVINCCALIGVVILKCLLLKVELDWRCVCMLYLQFQWYCDPLGMHRYFVRSTLQKRYRSNLMSSQKASVPFPFHPHSHSSACSVVNNNWPTNSSSHWAIGWCLIKQYLVESETSQGVVLLILHIMGVCCSAEKDPVPKKLLSYNRANRAVAILCNHQVLHFRSI